MEEDEEFNAHIDETPIRRNKQSFNVYAKTRYEFDASGKHDVTVYTSYPEWTRISINTGKTIRKNCALYDVTTASAKLTNDYSNMHHINSVNRWCRKFTHCNQCYNMHIEKRTNFYRYTVHSEINESK